MGRLPVVLLSEVNMIEGSEFYIWTFTLTRYSYWCTHFFLRAGCDWFQGLEACLKMCKFGITWRTLFVRLMCHMQNEWIGYSDKQTSHVWTDRFRNYTHMHVHYQRLAIGNPWAKSSHPIIHGTWLALNTWYIWGKCVHLTQASISEL